MPNHVKNVLTFTGGDSVIDELFKSIEGKNNSDDIWSVIDFNRIIPMPESLISALECSDKYLAMQCYAASDDIVELHIIQDANKLSDTKLRELIERGEKYTFNKVNYGHTTWYGWRVANWGTKWNAYETERADNSVIFNTAWSAPFPVITKLSNMFPTIMIDHKWADEDIGSNCGHIVWLGGEIVKNHTMNDEQRRQFALDLWDWEDEEEE